LAQEFHKHSVTGEKYYNRLLQQFPNSEYLWDHYILRDVFRDEKRVAQLEQQRKVQHNKSESDVVCPSVIEISILPLLKVLEKTVKYRNRTNGISNRKLYG
jgi:hypothetical protein